MKIETWQLDQRLALPLEAKIKMSLNRIKNFYEEFEGNVYVAIDGKDSNVMLHLIRSKYPDVKAIHVLTGVGFHENTLQLKGLDNIEFVRPKTTFFKIIGDGFIPFPTKQQAHFIHQAQRGKSEKHTKRLMTGYMADGSKTQFCISKKWRWLVSSKYKCSDICCEKLKKRPIKKFEKETGLKPFIGTMVGESNQRKFKYLKEGCNVFEGNFIRSTPIAFWTEQDILEYTLKYNLSLSKAYGEIKRDDEGILNTTGYKRTGCNGCPFGVHLEKEPNRFQIMEKTHPKLHDFYINKTIIGELLRECGIPTGSPEKQNEEINEEKGGLKYNGNKNNTTNTKEAPL